MQAVETGCNIAVDGGKTIKGTPVTIGGTCYRKALTKDNVPYLVAGVATNVGQCAGPSWGLCEVENCAGTTKGAKCAEQVPACTVYAKDTTVCTTPYKVQKGDTCYDVAKKNGVTLSALKKLNEGKCGANLQIGEVLCIQQTIKKGAATNKCVGEVW
jgi:hypothetical protein